MTILIQKTIQTQRYLSHTLTEFYAVKTYGRCLSIKFVCRRYKISKASLMRWNKKFDGTKESLIDKSLIKLYLNTLILIQM